MITPDHSLSLASLKPKIARLFGLSAVKIRSLEKSWHPGQGAPVFTVKGRYTARGWTEWTQGFQFGSALLQFDAAGDKGFLERARQRIVEVMASHVSHIGVHDHGFNNVSTYGNLLRLMRAGRIPENAGERAFAELALKVSGAVQAVRWSRTADRRGYIYSFNGPHSLFADTIRSLRSLALAHQLGHRLMGEMDRQISILERLIQHAAVTAQFNIWYGEGRDAYDARGRVAHESIFNVNDGHYRCPSSQQGYSPFSTWTRGLAWIMCGYAEQLEWLDTRPDAELKPFGGRKAIEAMMVKAASATCDFYAENTPPDGVPYWDTGAPGLAKLGDWASRPSDPFNAYEPVDSSAAAIAAQGLWRFGGWLGRKGQRKGAYYQHLALVVANTIFDAPYLSTDAKHQGLLLHSVYHRPNGWDHVPRGFKIPCGESSMWGDYHARELALLLLREAEGKRPLRFFDI
ncbi:MAG: glycoside hydrolase family 88 protein [Verrucomicrobiae bacterium]|nr:glycoside hydrolase family 88 protein [Verrucomicrobiae bacterium]